MKVTGRVFINVAGRGRLRSRPGAELNTGGVNREEVVGDDSVHGFREEIVAPTIECEISHTGNDDLLDLNNIVDDSVAFETDTGQTYIMQEAWLAEPANLRDGATRLLFKGVRVDKA